MKTSGSSYLLVLSVMLSVFIMLTLVMSITSSEVKTTIFYNNYSGIYNIAVSGAEKAIDIINTEIIDNYDKIHSDAMNTIRGIPINGITYYKLPENGDKYDGSFHLKQEDKNGVSGKNDYLYMSVASIAAELHTKNALDELLPGTLGPGKYFFNFKLSAEEEEYLASVEFTQRKVLSTVERTPGSIKRKIAAEIVYEPVEPKHNEIVIPSFSWKTVPSPFNYAIYSAGEINIYESTVNGDTAKHADEGLSFLFSQVPGTIDEWSKDNSVITSDLSLDIAASTLYDEAEPVSTLIISGGNINLSGEGGNCKAVILSRGIVTLKDINFEGIIISHGDVDITNSNIQYDADMLFDIRTTNSALYYKLLDYMEITRFNAVDSSEFYDMDTLLNNIIINDEWKLQLENFDGIKARMVKLAEQE